jgi:hypothetical protein
MLPGPGNEIVRNAKTNEQAKSSTRTKRARTAPNQDQEQAMRISREQIERLRAALRKAPEVPPGGTDTTKQEAVRLLVGEIQTLQQRGYSLEQIAEMFRDGGLVLTTPTLKSYLSRAKGSRKRRRAGQKTEAGGAAKAPAPTVVAPKVSRPDAADGARREAPTPMTSPAPAQPRPAGVGREGSRQDGASPAPESSRFRSGKDAFLPTDKDSY